MLLRIYAEIVIFADIFMMYMIARFSGAIGQVINTGIFNIFQFVLGISFLVLKTELAERIIQEQENANLDAMTGCANRRAYIMEIETLENSTEQRSYLAIDINGLKEVNDTYGHEAGDELIIGAARSIEQCFGEKGKILRIGGDEFIVLTAEGISDESFAAYEKRMQSWTKKHGMELSTSYGYARVQDYPGVTISELARIADGKMYQAKALYYRQTGKERRKHVYEK